MKLTEPITLAHVGKFILKGIGVLGCLGIIILILCILFPPLLFVFA